MGVAQTERYVETLLAPKETVQKVANVGLFLKNVHTALAQIQSCGIPAISERRETDSHIVMTITIPKHPGDQKKPVHLQSAEVASF